LRTSNSISFADVWKFCNARLTNQIDPDGREAVEGDVTQTRAEQFEELGLVDQSASTANAASQAGSALSSAGD